MLKTLETLEYGLYIKNSNLFIHYTKNLILLKEIKTTHIRSGKNVEFHLYNIGMCASPYPLSRVLGSLAGMEASRKYA